MKKVILSLIALVLTAGFVSAQDLEKATEIAQSASEALDNKDYATALTGFKEALVEAQACGEEGAELIATCKGVIPVIVLNIAKGEIRDAKYDEGIATLAEAIKVAVEYEALDVEDEAKTLVSQAKKAKAGALYKAKDFAGAVAAFKDVLAENPEDGTSALQLAMALNQTGDKEGAIAAFEQARANGQEANAVKQLANIFLKDAQALLKEKKFKDAIAACQKSNEYVESANAYKLAASAASQLKDNKSAIEFYEKYLGISPNAKDAAAINFTLGALYQQLGNKEKAKEFYTKVENDATYGAQAKQQLNVLK